MITDIDLDLIVKDSEVFFSKKELEDFLSILSPLEQAQFITSLTGGLSELEQRFVELFPHRYSWIKGYGHLIYGTNVDWLHIRGRLYDDELVINWSSPDTFIGVGFGKYTKYILLDIDADSKYHWTAQRVQIEEAIEKVGVNQVNWYESSGSEGLHGYIPFSEEIHSFGAACLITKTLKEAGFEIKDGQLEVFPNLRSYNSQHKSHRLPLQSGFGCTLPEFIEQWDEAAGENDAVLFNSLIQDAGNWVKQQKLIRIQKGLETGNAADWFKHLEETIKLGWTGYSQTNEILGVIAIYHRVFNSECDSVNKLSELMLQTATNCPGFKEYCGHKSHIKQRCEDWAKSCWKKYYRYVRGVGAAYVKKSPEENKNNIKTLDSQQKIKQAVASLHSKGLGISIRSVAKEAGVSTKTVSKHKDLLLDLATLHYERCTTPLTDSSEVLVSIGSVGSGLVVDDFTLHYERCTTLANESIPESTNTSELEFNREIEIVNEYITKAQTAVHDFALQLMSEIIEREQTENES